MKIRLPVFAVGDDKKRKGRYTKSQVHYISTKFGVVVGVGDVIIHTNFGDNTFWGFRFRFTWGQNFHFPIDFACHHYNSAAANAQPVIITSRWHRCYHDLFCSISIVT